MTESISCFTITAECPQQPRTKGTAARLLARVQFQNKHMRQEASSILKKLINVDNEMFSFDSMVGEPSRLMEIQANRRGELARLHPCRRLENTFDKSPKEEHRSKERHSTTTTHKSSK